MKKLFFVCSLISILCLGVTSLVLAGDATDQKKDAIMTANDNPILEIVIAPLASVRSSQNNSDNNMVMLKGVSFQGLQAQAESALKELVVGRAKEGKTKDAKSGTDLLRNKNVRKKLQNKKELRPADSDAKGKASNESFNKNERQDGASSGLGAEKVAGLNRFVDHTAAEAQQQVDQAMKPVAHQEVQDGNVQTLLNSIDCNMVEQQKNSNMKSRSQDLMMQQKTKNANKHEKDSTPKPAERPNPDNQRPKPETPKPAERTFYRWW
jgi:hypothetical protein